MDSIFDFVLSFIVAAQRGDVTAVGGFGALAYALAAVANGDTGFSVPYVTPWLQPKPKLAKTGIVIGVVVVAAVVISCLAGGWTAASAIVGAKAGLGAAITAIGGNTLVNNMRKPRAPAATTDGAVAAGTTDGPIGG